MTVPLHGHLARRLSAPFHVQIQLTRNLGDQPKGLVEGCAVRVFKGGDHLSVGDSVSFDVEILPPSQDPLAVPPGDFFYLRDDGHLTEVKYLEAFLEGAPPQVLRLPRIPADIER